MGTVVDPNAAGFPNKLAKVPPRVASPTVVIPTIVMVTFVPTAADITEVVKVGEPSIVKVTLALSVGSVRVRVTV